MNVYDFDDTILSGDTEIYFWQFIFAKYKNLGVYKFNLKFQKFLYGKLHLISKNTERQREYKFLKKIEDIDKEVEEFWTLHVKDIKQWYKDNQRPDDVIVSATPEFLLIPICKKLGITRLIATVMDKKTGKIYGLFNHREEKVKRFSELYDVKDIECFYSDSLNDSPMAEVSPMSYRVFGEQLVPWKDAINRKK